jgi:xanthosine utilization system XapX-like protein
MTQGKKHKSLLAAFLLGMIFPGLGLIYAAPWLVALFGTVGVIVTFKLLGWIPIVGQALMGVTALSSGGLNLLYARAYNREGKRLEVTTPARQLTR